MINALNLFITQNRLVKIASQLSQLLSGFTPTAILLATALSSVIYGFGSIKVVTALNKTQAESVQSMMNITTNRLAEFLSHEITKATSIETNISQEKLAKIASNFTLPERATPILAVKVADISENQRIIYYTKPAENPEIGPSQIYRWGPSMNQNGKYDSTEWTSEILLDLVDNTAIYPICSSGWKASTINAIQGFYACINNNGKIVEVHIQTIYEKAPSEKIIYHNTTIAVADLKAAGNRQ